MSSRLLASTRLGVLVLAPSVQSATDAIVDYLGRQNDGRSIRSDVLSRELTVQSMSEATVRPMRLAAVERMRLTAARFSLIFLFLISLLTLSLCFSLLFALAFLACLLLDIVTAHKVPVPAQEVFVC